MMFSEPRRTLARIHHRSGAAMVLLAILLPAVLLVATYSINTVYMEVVRTELQISTDIATRAAGRTFAVEGDKALAIERARQLAQLNQVGGHSLVLNSSDFDFGASTRTAIDQRYEYTPSENANAVKLRTDGFSRQYANGIPMLFPTFGVPIVFRPLKTAISTQAEVEVAIVLDRSGSMAYSDTESASFAAPAAAPPGWTFGDPVPPNSRWLDAVPAVMTLLDVFAASPQEERVSLSTYSDTPTTDTRLTTNYDEIRSSLQARSLTFNGGATNIGGGILEGAAALSDAKLARPWASRVIIVMSDGIHNTGYDPIMAAKAVASQHITIYTVSFSAEADKAQMQEIATIGAGKYYHASTGGELQEAFRDIAYRLPNLVTF